MVESKELEVLSGQELTKESVFVKKGLRKYLSRDEVNALLGRVEDGRDKMLMMTLWYTGLRVTEITGIRKADINWGDNLMRVRWLKSRRYYERIIPIRREIKELLYLYTINMKADDRVFPFTRQNVDRIIKKYDKRVHAHTFRHSFAVNFLKQTKDVVTLQLLMGHTNIRNTLLYLKIVPVDQAKVLEEVKFN